MRGEGGLSFSPRTLRWIIGLGSGSFLLALLLTAFADELGEPVSSGADSYSYSALGHRAFIEVLERNGLAVSRRRSERAVVLGPSAVLLAAEPYTALEGLGGATGRLDRLLERSARERVPLVLVLPKWQGLQHPFNPRWIADHEPVGQEAVQKLLDSMELAPSGDLRVSRESGRRDLICDPEWSEPVAISLPDAQMLEPSGALRPLVDCRGRILVARLSGHPRLRDLYLVSDPDILNNHGLGRADNALLATALFTEHLKASSVVVDETLHGFVLGSGPFLEIFRYPLVLALIHGLLVAGLVLWAGTGRFGKPQASPAALGSGKEVLIRNAALLMTVAGSTARALPAYLDQAIRAVAAHHYLSPHQTRASVLRRLQEIGKARGVAMDLGLLRREAHRMASASRPSNAGAVALALRIQRWRKEMTDVD